MTAQQKFKVSDYRTEAGEYALPGFTILRCGNRWQVRDQFGDIEAEFNMLQHCFTYIDRYTKIGN